MRHTYCDLESIISLSNILCTTAAGSDDEDEPPALPERLARNIRAMVEYIGNLESALDPSKSVGPPSLRRKRNSSKKLLSTTPRDINQGDTDEELRVPEFPGRLAEQQEFMSALLRVMRKRELPAGTPAHIDPPADPDLVDPPMWSPPSSAALLKTPLYVLLLVAC